MEKTIKIDGKDVKFKATAATPRLYRLKFKRDLIKDLAELSKVVGKKNFNIPDLELFENVSYIMAKQADSQVPDDINEWLDDFSTFAMSEILPEIMEQKYADRY